MDPVKTHDTELPSGLTHAFKAPFLGESTKAGFTKPGEAPAPNKQVLSFGPIQTPKGWEVQNITRGKTDLQKYEVGKVYVVHLQLSIFKDRAYYSTVKS